MLTIFLKGGKGSGNRDHAGRPGHVGGSAPTSHAQEQHSQDASRNDPSVRQEKRGIRLLYKFALANPLAEPQALAVALGGPEFRTILDKGPAIAGKDGEIRVTGNELGRKTGSAGGYGMVKIIWKHGEKSEKAGTPLEVRLSDILYLPHALRDHKPVKVVADANGVPVNWTWVIRRHDGAELMYGVSRMTATDDQNHVVTIHVNSASIKKALWIPDPTFKAESGYCSLVLQSPSGSQSASKECTPFLLVVNGAWALRKAEGGGAGGRWITVHPNGKSAKGVPVMIQESHHGSGVYHVIGGAGGKLNYLKLRGVKSKERYAQEVREKQSDKRAVKREQSKRDKESGAGKAKAAQREQVRAQVQQHERKFIETVAGKMGWKKEDLELPAEKLKGLSESATKRATAKHHAGLLRQAESASKLQARKLAIQADKNLANELHEPIEDPRENGLGYAPNFAGRTQHKADEIKDEAAHIDGSRKSPEQKEQASKSRDRATAIRTELERADLPTADLKATLADTKEAVELVKAHKLLRKAREQARDANRAIDRGEQKAYVLEVSDAGLYEDVRKGVENDLRTLRTRAFLSEVGKIAGGEEAIGRHVAVGAYNALNSVSLATAGTGVIDRDAVDVLGTAGAAQAMAARLRADLSPDDYEAATTALQSYHVDHYMQRSGDALREAAALQDTLSELKLPDAADGHDLTVARELNQRRHEAIGKTRQALGHALGEMEAHAALLVAMKGKQTTPLKMPLGLLDTVDALRRLHAIGLDRGDYTIEHAGRDVIATISPAGQLKLAKPTDREHLRAVQDSLDIIEGRQDDANFWPQGVARRPDLALAPQRPGAAADLAQPFTPGADLKQSIRDYIGGRMADGHAIGDIVSDLQSEDLARLTDDRRSDYFQALHEVVPLAGKDGKPIEHEARRAEFQQHAEDFVREHHGAAFSPLHAQPLVADDVTVESLHRAYAKHPAGPLAFKSVGELKSQDQAALRAHFDEHFGNKDPATSDLRQKLTEHVGAEPEKEVDDMFGRGTNPQWTAWKQSGDAMREKIAASGIDWQKYQKLMGGTTAAYAAMQDHLKGQVVQAFADTHNRLRPDAPLKLGSAPIANHLRHLDAVDPESREKRMAEHRELIDGLRSRAAGRYASGSVQDRMDAARERQAAAEQAQMGFFAAAPVDDMKPRELGKDERHTVGAAAENVLARVSETVGQNFKPGQSTPLFQPSMTGKFAPQQRAIKLIERNKRLALTQGVGSGKSLMGLGAFAHLHTQGKTRRGIFAVPSIVQGQFGGEALRFLEPGKFKWHAEPGASRAERIAAYKDPGTHFSVVTHQALRDDMVHLGAKHAGISEDEMSSKLASMSRADRQAWARQTMDREGMDHDFLMVDEGHNLLNRAGKDDSSMANVADAVSDNMKHYVNASADPIKNDPSEAFDLLSKMDPARYQDRASFMRRYGINTLASGDALRREMARYYYPGRIDSGVKVRARDIHVPLSAAQKQSLEEVDEHVGRMRMAKLGGTLDVQSAKQLSPDSFEGVPEDQHHEVAQRLHESVGILKQTARARVLDAHPENAKTDEVSRAAAERRGKPGVVFARSRAAVKQIEERLKAEGHRVVSITGADSAKDKAAKRLQFRPDSGEAKADVLVMSDAGATGLNAQRGSWLIQYDQPMTAMVHAQRNGRINRLGNANPEIELMNLIGDHEHERESQKRLRTKYGLRDMLTSPLEGLDDTGFAAYLKAAHKAEQKAAA